MNEALTSDELKRYSRHLLLPEFGLEGQLRLKKAKVLVVGCGGLGSPVLLYLAAAGVGTIGIIDNDNVEESNLQRQVLYGSESVGKPKVLEAAKRLQSLNSFIEIIPFNTTLSSKNALEIISDYDLVIDGTDNFPTRYLVNDACVILKKPFIYGAIYRFEGQVAIFNVNGGTNYRDLFPSPPRPELAPNCAEAGVLGVLPAIVGSLQANEAIKYLSGIGQPLIGKLFVIDALTLMSRTIKIPKNPNANKITELIDYDAFCQISKIGDNIENISAAELKEMLANNVDFQLIDVREANEYQIRNIGGELMPLSHIEDFLYKISNKKLVVIHCQSGVRSQKAIDLLTKKYGYKNLKNLEGGIGAFFSN